MSTVQPLIEYVQKQIEPVTLFYSGINFILTTNSKSLTVSNYFDDGRMSEMAIVPEAPLMKLVNFLSEATVFLDPSPNINPTSSLYILNDIQKRMNPPCKEKTMSDLTALVHVINESHNAITFDLGGLDFVLATTPTSVLVTATDKDGETKTIEAPLTDSRWQLASQLSDLTRIAIPEENLVSVVSVFKIDDVLNDIITCGPNLVQDPDFLKLIKGLRKHPRGKAIIEANGYVGTVRYGNGVVTCAIAKVKAYRNTAHFSRASTLNDIAEYIVTEYSHTDGVTPPTQESVLITLGNI